MSGFARRGQSLHEVPEPQNAPQLSFSFPKSLKTAGRCRHLTSTAEWATFRDVVYGWPVRRTCCCNRGLNSLYLVLQGRRPPATHRPFAAFLIWQPPQLGICQTGKQAVTHCCSTAVSVDLTAAAGATAIPEYSFARGSCSALLFFAVYTDSCIPCPGECNSEPESENVRGEEQHENCVYRIGMGISSSFRQLRLSASIKQIRTGNRIQKENPVIQA